MARRQDRVMQELKAIRRKMNDRLYNALKKGRLEREVEQIEKEGLKTLRSTENGAKNGHRRRNP